MHIYTYIQCMYIHVCTHMYVGLRFWLLRSRSCKERWPTITRFVLVQLRGVCMIIHALYIIMTSYS